MGPAVLRGRLTALIDDLADSLKRPEEAASCDGSPCLRIKERCTSQLRKQTLVPTQFGHFNWNRVAKLFH
jgi:hypothetical protein